MSIYRELDYTPKIRSIIRIEFGILSPEEIIKRSVAHVHKTTLYENISFLYLSTRSPFLFSRASIDFLATIYTLLIFCLYLLMEG